MLIYFTIKTVFQLHYSERCVRKNTSLTGMSKSIIRVREYMSILWALFHYAKHTLLNLLST